MATCIPDPWTPVQAHEENGTCDIRVWGRSYRHERAFLPTGITALGEELLYAPMRLTGVANGEPISWEDDAGCYLLSATRKRPR